MMHQGLQHDYVALVGMGGVGKSELAAQYVKLHQNDYGGITWFNARDNLAGEVLGFFSLELGLELPEHLKAANLQKQIAWCWSKYPASPLHILIIFDDVTKLEQLQQAIPNDGRFRVLVTTRLQNLNPNYIQQIPLDVLSPEKEPGKALALLQNLLGKKDKRINTEPEAATAICKFLEYLPLGIILVGSYLVQDPGLSLTQILERLRKQKLEEEALQDRETLNQTQLGVKAAFNLTWQELDAKAQQLGAFLSLFSPQFILWVLVVWVIEYKAEDEEKQLIWTEEELNTAKKQLYQRNLLQQIEDTAEAYKIHALVRWFLQEKLAETGEMQPVLERTFINPIINLASEFPQSPTSQDIENFKSIVSHWEDLGERLTAAIKGKTEAQINLPASILADEIIWPFMGIGIFYEGQGLYQLAETWYQECVEIYTTLFKEDHPDVASSLNNLAVLYDSQGRYSEAEPLYVQALEMKKRLFTSDHPHVASSLNNLAALYKNQGRYSEAEPLLVQALEMRKRLFTSNHPDVASSLNNLALLYESQGRYSEAEPLYLQTLEMRLFTSNHPDVASSLNNLAGLYKSQGRYSEAEPLYVQALEMRKRLFTSDHPHVASSLNNLAGLYKSQGRYSEAEPLYVQALGMFERVLGFEHPNTVTVRENLRIFRQQLQPVSVRKSPLSRLVRVLIFPFYLLWRFIKSMVIWCWHLCRR
ncbi:MAG TPA: tetratricopeptide repeat protein [Nostocaceae cyanobacterium]|nr:tetratricopeptide repeat protein [Nostocaceae cyanobacterium]